MTGMFRAGDAGPSRDAATLALNCASKHRKIAYAHLTDAGQDGLTDFELADLSGIAQTSIGKRRLELVEQGVVAPLRDDNGRQTRRRTPSGATAGVWVVVSQ